jgi:hypothetical protein
MHLVELAKTIQNAEFKVRSHAKDADIGRIVKMNEY